MAVHKSIMDMICADMQPLSMIEDTGFRMLIKQAWPKYDIPSRKFFSEKLSSIYTAVHDKVKARLPSDGWLSFGTDGWSSKNGEHSFLSLTVHWLDDYYKPQHAVLNVDEITGRHTGQALLDMFQHMLQSWGIESDRVHTVVTDSGGNIVKVSLFVALCKFVQKRKKKSKIVNVT